MYLQHCTVSVEKNLPISGSTQFKPEFRDQLYCVAPLAITVCERTRGLLL